MKKQIGNGLALYPTPLVVVGTMVDGKPNWVLVGHLGIIGHDRVMVSLAKPHYTKKGITKTRKLSITFVEEALLPLRHCRRAADSLCLQRQAFFPF